MTNCKHGGSLASDAVSDLVSSKAFDKMTLNASNKVGGKKSHRHNNNNVVCSKCAKLLSGGSPALRMLAPAPAPAPASMPVTTRYDMDDSMFAKYGGAKGGSPALRMLAPAPAPAPALSPRATRYDMDDSMFAKYGGAKGGAPALRLLAPAPAPAPAPALAPRATRYDMDDSMYGSYGGSSSRRLIKNINEYKSKHPFKLYNGRGGNAEEAIAIGLRSDSSITSYNKAQGTFQNRIADATALKVLANEDISGPIQMNKTLHYGDVTGVAEHGTKFSYAGGKRRPTKKPATKKPKPATKKPKPAQKKRAKV